MASDSVAQAFGRAAWRARAACEKECLAAEREPDPGFLVDLRFHDLRHEATSCLFERGMNTMSVAAITGHKPSRGSSANPSQGRDHRKGTRPP